MFQDWKDSIEIEDWNTMNETSKYDAYTRAHIESAMRFAYLRGYNAAKEQAVGIAREYCERV